MLHSPDFHIDQSTLLIDNGICLTATIEILRAIAVGKGPASAVLALGYAGWGPGQLEDEIQANSWLSVTPDEGLIFGEADDQKWQQAMAKLKVDPALLSGAAGHA